MDQHKEATLRGLRRERNGARDDKQRLKEIDAEIRRIEALPEPPPVCAGCGRVLEEAPAPAETDIQRETRRRQAEFDRVSAGGVA